jgi:hypothetical protein
MTTSCTVLAEVTLVAGDDVQPGAPPPGSGWPRWKPFHRHSAPQSGGAWQPVERQSGGACSRWSVAARQKVTQRAPPRPGRQCQDLASPGVRTDDAPGTGNLAPT